MSRPRRQAAIAALIATGCIAACATASASAASVPRMHVVGVPRSTLLALSPFTRLRPFTFYAGERQTSLAAYPSTVSVNDIDYTMHVLVSDTPASFGMDEQSYLDVNLGRRQPAAVGKALQEYDYNYSPNTAFAFAYDHTALSSASVDTGSLISPDALTATFTATGTLNRRTCQVSRSGRRGTMRSITGDFSYSQFSIDTTTTPFFGVLTQGPLHGALTVDPGCGFDDSGFRARRNICPAHEAVEAASGSSTVFAVANYRRKRGFEAAFSSPIPVSYDSNNYAFGLIESPIATGDLPPPKHSMHGATARIRSTGNPFMSGSATFHSGRAPHITKVHRCFAFGHWHRFRRLTYEGRIRQHTDPFTALFDTGSVPIPAFAHLVIWRYLS